MAEPTPEHDRIAIATAIAGHRAAGFITAQRRAEDGNGWRWDVTEAPGVVHTVNPLDVAYAPASGIAVWIPMDDDSPHYTAAMVDIRRWNGWASPWFTAEESHRIAADMAAMHAEFGDDSDVIAYDSERDTFTHTSGYGDDRETWDVPSITLDGVKLWGIGGWQWTWEEFTPSAEDVDDSAECTPEYAAAQAWIDAYLTANPATDAGHIGDILSHYDSEIAPSAVNYDPFGKFWTAVAEYFEFRITILADTATED